MLSLFVVIILSLTLKKNRDIIKEITENVIVLLFSGQGGVPIERTNCRSGKQGN